MSAAARSLQAQIDHVDAAIVGIEHGLELNAARKRPDGMDGIRRLKLDGWRDIRATLVWVQGDRDAFRAYATRPSPPEAP